MKRILLIFAVVAGLLNTACINEANIIGPAGLPGLAFFGVDYQYNPPYSYWDNNPNIPQNPILGEYYPTNPGIYEFEYFFNAYEYYFGTYEIWINPGQPGQPYNTPGVNGLDSYLMLICDAQGIFEFRTNKKGELEPIIIEERFGDKNYRITLYKTSVANRVPQGTPKYKK